jgi:hypothetical protein
VEAVAVQRKEREKPAKAEVKTTPEVQIQAVSETGAMAGMPLFMQSGAGARGAAAPPPSPWSSPLVQRMCKECAEELAGTDKPLQRAVTIGAVDDPMEREADAVAAHVMRKAGNTSTSATAPTVQRKSAGPLSVQRLCKRCSAELNEQAPPVRRKSYAPGVQRLCAKCAAELDEVQPKSEGDGGGGAAPSNVSSLIASPGSGSPLPQSVREHTEPVLNADLSGVRVHSGANAQQAAADINAKAFTHGNNIFLGRGQSSNDLGLMAHELTHTVQQGASPALQRSPADNDVSVSSSNESNYIQRISLPSVDDVVGTLSDIGEAVSGAAESVVETGEEIVEGGVALAEEAAEAVQGIAREVWDTANAIASAIGGMVSFSGGRLTISVPSFPACPVIPLQFSLPSAELFIPIVAGAIPIPPDLEIDGAIGIKVSLTPEISAQLGPCRVHGLHLVIDPLHDYYSVAGWITVTTAFGLGAELSVGARGEVGATVIIPMDPPIPLRLSAGLEAGIAGQVRAIDAATTDLKAAATYSGGVFSGAMREENDVGLALDWGVGGYGQLDVLGINLCRLYWPLLEGHWDTAMHYEVNAAMTISSSGFAASLSIGGFRPIPFSSMPVELNRDVLTDDCVVKDALCAILYALGWMPSQNGGSWTGHPEPYWPGPLDVYPRSPAIASGHSCRGACGPNCDTCTPPQNKVICLPRPAADGGEGQDLLVYPNYQECDTHAGCREHDACYDWCAASSGGPSGVGPFLCRRLCDFECLCSFRPYQCIGWVFGAEPHDGKMVYSDEPRTVPGCDIPCPEEGEGDGEEGGGGYTVCLPTLELFEELSDGDSWSVDTDEYSVWRKDIIVPYVGLVTLELNASAGAEAEIQGSLGPGTMENICFDVDPLSGHYVARGEIQIPARLSGSLTLRARLSADASWFLVVKVASAIGTLSATGEVVGRANLNPTLRAQVEVDCDGGLKPSLVTDINFPRCLDLAFDMNARFDLEALTFNIYSHTWNLLHADWNHCWGEEIDVDANPGREPDLDLRSIRLSIPELIRWLMSDEAGQHDETPDTARTVVEDPLTTATAKTIGTISGDLNRTTYNSSTLTLSSDPCLIGSSATAGDSMMTRYLTHEKTGGGKPSGQTALYGFRKLPTLAAFGGSGAGIADKTYIRGHLLNHSPNRSLHGVGQARNLFPITAEANDVHNSAVEEPIKDLVHDDKVVVMYGVTVVNKNGPHLIDVYGDGTCCYQYINAGFSCTYATYKLYSDDTVELNTPIDRTVPSNFDASGFTSGVAGKGCPQK